MEKNIPTTNFETWHNEFFTNYGYDVLSGFMKELIKIYTSRKENEYPLRLGVVLDMPILPWAAEIKNKDELLGRIKMIGQLLGKERVEIDVGGDSKLIFEFGML